MNRMVRSDITRRVSSIGINFIFIFMSFAVAFETYSSHECYEGKFTLAIGTAKSINLPRMMFMTLCAIYNSSDMRGPVPFTGFLTQLFKRHGVHIPVDLTRTEPEKPIDRYSLTRSEG